VFSYPDAQRYRVGTNYNQLPVNAPHAASVHNYSQDGAQRHHFNAPTTPVYAPNSFGGPVADPALAAEGGWETDGEFVRSAYTLRAEDSDFGQAGTLYRDVYPAEAKVRFLETLSGQAHAITIDDIRERFFQYWTNVDAGLGAALREAYAAGVNADAPQQPEADEDAEDAEDADAA
jgi:catalase